MRSRAIGLLGVALMMAGTMLVGGCGGEDGSVSDRIGGASEARGLTAIFRGDATPLVRTDFQDDAAWQRVVSEVTKEVDFGDEGVDEDEGGPYAPSVEVLEDGAFDGMEPSGIAAAWDRSQEVAGYVLVADEQSMHEAATGDEITVVYLDLTPTDEDAEEFGWIYGRTFRVVTGEVASIEANLSISNMDFAEFADYADERGGVFRGFAPGD